MNLEELKEKYDKLQEKFGSKTRNSVYGGGCEKSPELCLVFMNPTARNIATDKSWNGVRYQWLGTKQVWKFLSSCNLFDESLNFEIQKKKANEWTEEFCVKIYDEVETRGIYITNLAKCTQEDARPLSNSVFLEYRKLFLDELDLICPKKIILFGNQVSSIVLGENISVSLARKKEFTLKTKKNSFSCFPVYYPVGNGFFNTPKAIEDIKHITEKI